MLACIGHRTSRGSCKFHLRLFRPLFTGPIKQRAKVRCTGRLAVASKGRVVQGFEVVEYGTRPELGLAVTGSEVTVTVRLRLRRLLRLLTESRRLPAA